MKTLFNMNPHKWYYLPALITWIWFLITACIFIAKALTWYACFLWNLF